ncbi:hypothetical protein I541_4305 [Mycobacteroides abscessus]|nr:hypothetical protein I541_4305 [Mycobacteroides abscessus]
MPGWRSRAERFDMAVLEAYEPIERALAVTPRRTRCRGR